MLLRIGKAMTPPINPVQVDAVQVAFNLDALRSSHPIEVPVKNAIEVDQIFDAISYYKGSSIIHMLSNYIGTKVFLQGVADYLKLHSFGKLHQGSTWVHD